MYHYYDNYTPIKANVVKGHSYHNYIPIKANVVKGHLYENYERSSMA